MCFSVWKKLKKKKKEKEKEMALSNILRRFSDTALLVLVRTVAYGDKSQQTTKWTQTLLFRQILTCRFGPLFTLWTALVPLSLRHPPKKPSLLWSVSSCRPEQAPPKVFLQWCSPAWGVWLTGWLYSCYITVLWKSWQCIWRHSLLPELCAYLWVFQYFDIIYLASSPA